MQAFEFYCPTKIYFGKGAEARVGEAVKHFGGTKVFIVYGGHSAVKSGLIARIEQTLTDAGLEHMSFGGVQPNPRLSHAREGVQKALAFGADFILGVGGGSVMDTSKAIAHGVANPETDIWDFWSKKAALTKTSKLGAVLTISAAGSETSDSAVLTNDETTLKRGLNTDLQRPLFAIMDPELTYTLPRYQVGCGVVDIMMHTLERYFNPGHPSNRMTDEIAEGLLRTVIDAGRVAMQDSHNYDAMSEIAQQPHGPRRREGLLRAPVRSRAFRYVRRRARRDALGHVAAVGALCGGHRSRALRALRRGRLAPYPQGRRERP